jgi:hypothetical protein
MKNLLRTTITALMLTGVTQVALGQIQTDELLSLNFKLTALSQGGVVTNKNTVTTSVQTQTLTSADVVQALGASLGQPFSTNAGLFLLTPTNDLDAWTVQVRDGNLAVDVSGFFVHQAGNDVGSSSLNTKTGAANNVDYSADNFVVQDQGGFPSLGLHLSLSGLTRTTSKTTVSHGAVVSVVDKISAQVSGNGDSQGNPVVLSGTVTAVGLGQETVIIGAVGD